MKANIGLVLEGGGMRGVYTGGVLQYFMEQDFYPPYVIGVSAGACQGSSYISRQPGRNKKVTVDYASHPKYISMKSYLKKGQLFDMDFIFNEIPLKLVPFDFEAMKNSGQRFLVGVTDVETGEPRYFDTTQLENDDMLTVTRASSSLPYMAPKVKFQDLTLMDGGIADPIPIRKSEADGNSRNIVILTRNPGYRKKPAKGRWFVKGTNIHQRHLARSILSRSQKYNDTIAYIEGLEQEGKAFVIQPRLPLEVRRVERDTAKLEKLYWQGYEDAKSHFENLQEWLNG